MKEINYKNQGSGARCQGPGERFQYIPLSLWERVRVRGKSLLLSLFTVLCLTAAPAHALDISDYTAYPPFLPRVTSPNILFMLDCSDGMVKL